MSKKKFAILLSMIVVAFTGFGIYAAAQQEDSSQMIYACTKENGQIRLIDKDVACSSDEKKIFWNVVGPAGPAGKDGVDGAVGPQGPPGISLPGDVTDVLNYDVYLRLDNIKGESANEQYVDWIVLTGVEFDASHPGIGSISGGTGKPTLNEFVIKKNYDSASIPIFQALLEGRHLSVGEIVFVSRGESPTPILTIKLNEVFISNYSFDNVYETIELSFGKIESTYSGVTPPVTDEFDFRLNK